MMSGVTLSVVVPAFNEEARLGATLVELCAYLRRQPWDWEIRVVDDGSTDATREVAAQQAGGEPRWLLRPEPRRGKGDAVKAGLLASRCDLRFICDADLSMPVDELPRF